MADTDHPYGFAWGPIEVQRICEVQRGGSGAYRVLRVSTAHGPALDIYISPTGRSVRVFRDGTELKAPQR